MQEKSVKCVSSYTAFYQCSQRRSRICTVWDNIDICDKFPDFFSSDFLGEKTPISWQIVHNEHRINSLVYDINLWTKKGSWCLQIHSWCGLHRGSYMSYNINWHYMYEFTDFISKSANRLIFSHAIVQIFLHFYKWCSGIQWFSVAFSFRYVCGKIHKMSESDGCKICIKAIQTYN